MLPVSIPEILKILMDQGVRTTGGEGGIDLHIPKSPIKSRTTIATNMENFDYLALEALNAAASA
jgi:hypothetical protein